MWYASSLLFKSVHVNHADADPVWEERIVLLEAWDDAEARDLAGRMGKDGEHEYYVSKAKNDLLRWTFVQIHKLYPIEDATLHSGSELFSRFLRQGDVDNLLRPFEDGDTKTE